MELDLVFFLELFDLLVGSRLLPSKLVAWVGNDLDALFFVLLGQLNEALVVRISQTSLGRDVHNKCRLFASKLLHTFNLLSIDGHTRLVKEVTTLRLWFGISQICIGGEILNTIDQTLEWTKEYNIRKLEWSRFLLTLCHILACNGLVPIAVINVDANGT